VTKKEKGNTGRLNEGKTSAKAQENYPKIKARAWRNKNVSMEKRLNPGDKSKCKDKARTRLRRRQTAIEPRLRLSMTSTQKKPSSSTTVTTAITTGREKWSVYYTLTRVGANITIARYLARDEDNYRARPPKVPTYTGM